MRIGHLYWGIVSLGGGIVRCATIKKIKDISPPSFIRKGRFRLKIFEIGGGVVW